MCESLQTPEKFDFPFEPYTIQHEFMRQLYKVIEHQKLGIFESPTGTVSIYFQFHCVVKLVLYKSGKISKYNLWCYSMVKRPQ